MRKGITDLPLRMYPYAPYFPSKKCSQNVFPLQAMYQVQAVQALSKVDVTAAKLISWLVSPKFPVPVFLMFTLPSNN